MCWKDTLVVPYALIEISSRDLTGEDGWKCKYWPGPGEDESMSLSDWYHTTRMLMKVKRALWLFGV